MTADAVPAKCVSTTTTTTTTTTTDTSNAEGETEAEHLDEEATAVTPRSSKRRAVASPK